MAPSTIPARLAQAKNYATTRLEAANQIDPEQTFDNFEDASKASSNCNKSAMQLMDSYNTLQRLHHEWEILIDDLSKSEDEAEQQRSQEEQKKLDEVLQSEDSFPFFYAQLTQAQMKMYQAVQNAVQQSHQFFQSGIHATSTTTEETLNGSSSRNEGGQNTILQADEAQNSNNGSNIFGNFFNRSSNYQQPPPGSFSFLSPPVGAQDSGSSAQNSWAPEPADNRKVSFLDTTSTLRPVISLTFEPLTKPISSSTIAPATVLQNQSLFGSNNQQQSGSFMLNVKPQPSIFGTQLPTVSAQSQPNSSFVPQTNTVGSNVNAPQNFVPQNFAPPGLQSQIQQQNFQGQQIPGVIYQPTVYPAYQQPQPQHLSFAIPKIAPPKFDGNSVNFRNFWQIYSLIHNNPNYSNAEKLAYLLGCLTGSAKAAFEGYDICDVNYQPVVDALHQMYGQPNQVLSALYKQYDQVPVANNNTTDIAKAINSMECYLRQLHALGINTEDMGLQQTYMKKLPNAFLLKACSNGFPSTFQALRDTVRVQMQLELQFQSTTSNKEKTSVNATSAAPVANVRRIQKEGKSENKEEKSEEKFQQTKEKKYPCIFCGKEDHRSTDCNKFSTLKERKKCLKEKGICESCLMKHESPQCCEQKFCRKCRKKGHPTLMCEKLRKYEKEKVDESKPHHKFSTKSYAVKVDVSVSKARETAMPIGEAKIFHPNKEKFETSSILLDSASVSTFINEELAIKLKLPIIKDNVVLEISRFGDTVEDTIQTDSNVVQFDIEAENGDFIAVEAYTIPTLTQALPTIDKDLKSKIMVMPKILIGNDYYSKIVLSEELPNGFSKLPSRIGPIICGTGTFVNSLSTKVVKNDETLEEKHAMAEIPKFWDTENFEDDHWQDDELVKHFCKTAKIVDGRIQIELPFAKDPTTLPTNEFYALKCLISLLQRLAENPDNLRAYDEQIQYLIQNLMIELIPLKEKLLKGHYLSHHCVLTPEKTTPLRVVHNCSGRMSKTAPCLNDFLEPGPPLMPKILDVLLRYQMAPILVVGDVQKAFLQIRVAPEHRRYLRFFWLKDIEQYLKEGFQKGNILAYQFAVVLFGSRISPFFLNIALMVLFKSMEDKELGEELQLNTYADNGGVAAKTPEEAIYKTKATIEAFASVKMNFRGIMSNDATVRQHFGVEPVSMSMLGLKWDPSNDILQIIIPATILPSSKAETKRTVTAEIGKKYDPLGLVAPVVVRYKIFLQKLWTSKLKWDDKLPPEIVQRWNEILDDKIEFTTPRFVGSPFANTVTEIHVFADASKLAYAAVIYLLHKDMDSSQKEAKFLICKTKVAPVKPMSIPRLELSAALLATKLVKYILQTLPQLATSEQFLWTDSSAVFYWLQSDKTLKTFVKNRVNMIKEANLTIRHVPTADNPADIASRGCSMIELKSNLLWKNGPAWLVTNQWPSIITFTPKIDSQEILSEIVLAVKADVKEPPELLYSAEEATSWIKLLRVTATCKKFSDRCRKKTTAGSLLASEIQSAEKLIIKQLQQKYPPSTQTSANLKLAMDDDGLIHMQSRIQHCGVDALANPLFLPDCPEVRLLILGEHQKIMHGGPKATLAKVREKFWIPKGLLVVKKAISKCRICVRYKALPYSLPTMPNLPTARVNEHIPFSYCGIDAAGPWKLKGCETKRWILLITCFTTRAVHLEVLEDMTAKCCMNAIVRFMGAFNTATNFLSDHGSNFKAASTLITKWHAVIHDPDLINFNANHQITWNFITERSPWKGGLYERLIGVMKNCLKFAMGRRQLTPDDFHTVVKQVQGIMNSRPIVDIDPEKQPLRPIDFLVPQARLTVPDLEGSEADDDDPTYNPKPSTAEKLQENFKIVNACLSRYWEKWIQEYLPQLRDTSALLHKQKGLNVRPQIDDVVLIEEEDLVPRGAWRLGRIVDVKESADGKVREAAVKVGNGNILNRSPSQLYPLEANLEPRIASARKPIINPIYLTVLMLILLPMVTALPAIDSASCIGDMLTVNSTDVRKIVVRFPHRAKDFEVNSTTFNISLPPEIAITGGILNLIAYSSDGIFVQQEIFCEPHGDHCSIITCYFCYNYLINYHCWHRAVWILIAVIFLILTLTVFKVCKKSPKRSLFAAGAARLFNLVKRSNKNDSDEMELQPLPKDQTDNKSCLTKIETNPLRNKAESTSADRSLKYMRRTSHLAVGILVIFMVLFQPSDACTKSVVIQAGKESCIIDKTGWTKCQFTQQHVITAHSESEVCMLFQSDAAPVATLTLQTFVQAKCVKAISHITALGDIDIESYKHCPGMGQCQNQFCAEISPTEHVTELTTANKHVGITGCVESCGSLTCGCPLFGTGCTFYRYFIKLNEPNINVFSCKEWTPEIHVKITIQSSKTTKNETFHLYEGEEFKFQNITFHLKRLTLPFLDIFQANTYFLQNKTRLSWIDHNAKKQADIVKCKVQDGCSLKPDVCRCLPADSTVKCVCGSQNELKRQWREHTLPSVVGQHMILHDEKLDPIAHLPAIYDMIIETVGFKASEYILNASREVQQTSLKGRIGPEGAILNITCVSSFGQIMGHIECLQQSFYAKCSPNGTVILHRWYSTKKVVNEICNLKCFETSSSFKVYGILSYIDADDSWNFIHGNGTNTGTDILNMIGHGFEFIYDRILYLVGGLGAVAIIVFILK